MALWVRFTRDGTEGFGTLDGETIAVHSGDLLAGATPTGATLALADVALLPPVRPGAFIGLWNNFHAAAAKQGNPIPEFPLYFLKNPRCVIGPGAAIRPPAGYEGKVLYEGELGLVIGKRVSNADEAEAGAAIFGLTCVNDVTALDLLFADASFPQWARAKGADSFGPIGPVIATGLDWSALSVKVALNGRVRQDYPLSDMIIPPARIVSLISREMTLQPGDVIACGTSLGALPMRPGMQVAVTIEGIGTLENAYAPAA
ncbi:fumarylacetoacetate hydrolase family protein [Siccirubricoccus sp. KC 17139]|uniref:Fumarylacetoacetate hydrolase family protein n=1 Tax=Siccirubricoccus soli TaxID=2899147 RepID=A0ABT1D873_9PROT|nr:fumarylacetoacetate hydrolase family protein [Siccirubricoccus soli]MCO6418113.1 fumarylacetoacetate hydrolase family protein [Siccirubricoccus soli]MCP2684248.1 fumarylacetoacetate hydrolase family protein [Siccirubricoccus soli]